MSTRKWAPVLLPFTVGLLGSNLNWWLIGAAATWGEVLASLYYIPIVIAAISIGWRAAVLVSLAAGGSRGLALLFGRGEPVVQTLAQAMLFVCVGLTAAKLAEWLRDGPAPAVPNKKSPPDSLEQSFGQVRDTSEMSAL